MGPADVGLAAGGFIAGSVVSFLTSAYGWKITDYFQRRAARKGIPSGEARPARSIAGDWQQRWYANSPFFPRINESLAHMRHEGNRVTATWESKGRRYLLDGRVEGDYITGDWSDTEKGPGTYFGVFQLIIGSDDTMTGMYLGFHRRQIGIEEGTWQWKRPTAPGYWEVKPRHAKSTLGEQRT